MYNINLEICPTCRRAIPDENTSVKDCTYESCPFLEERDDEEYDSIKELDFNNDE